MSNAPHKAKPENAPNWLVTTDQMWKLYIAILGFGGTLLCFLIGGFLLAVGAKQFLALAACGTFLGFATFVWLMNVIRCPNCHAKLVWTMFSTRSHLSWLVELAALESCPACKSLLIQQHSRHQQFH